MAENGIDIMVIGKTQEFCFLTGYDVCDEICRMRTWGDWIDCMIFSQDKGPVMVERDSDQPASTAPDYPFEERFVMTMDHEDPDATLKRALDWFSPENKTIGIPKGAMAQTAISVIRCEPKANVIGVPDYLIDEVRLVKEEDEIQLMRTAGAITSDILNDVAKAVKVGMTVHDVRAELSYQIIRRGSFGFAFYPGVGCVNPDSDPKDRGNPNNILTPRSTLYFDYGIVYKGYHTDFGRTLFVAEPLDIALEPYRIITGIVQEIVEKAGDGKMTPADMYHLGIQRAKETGYYEGYGYYKWSIGHSIGTDTHEWPWLRDPHSSTYKPIKEGMIFALEPKINHWGQFYLRTEDDILIGKEKAEVLTPFTYDPVVVG